MGDTPDFSLAPGIDNYAVMGNPVAHSKSPQIHQAFARQTRQSLHYQAIFVPEGGFPAYVEHFHKSGGLGLNITLPYKEEAFELASTLTERAQSAGAVNTLCFDADGTLRGDNTDGAGLVRDLGNNGIGINGRRLLILGAGGAVRGVLGPLLALQPAQLLVANRTLPRAKALVSAVNTSVDIAACGLDQLAERGSFDVIINATSSGLRGELPDLPVTLLGTETCCYDMVYGNTEPVFVRWSRSLGAGKAVDGLGMLVEQAAESFYIWRGVRPTTAPVIKMLRGAGAGDRGS